MSGRTPGNARNANGSAYRKLWRQLRDQRNDCGICSRPIDYELRHPHPMSFTLDHVHPISRWREYGYPSKEAMALDPRNVQAAHRRCNIGKSDKEGAAAKPKRKDAGFVEPSAPW